MRKAFIIAALVALCTVPAALAEGPPEMVTFCHVAGLASDPANSVTLTLPVNAVYGQAGHFNENGTTQAGHEQDYLGACNTPEEPPVDPPVDPPVTPETPVDPPAGPTCVFTGAGLDGEEGNDNCAIRTVQSPVVVPPVVCPVPEAIVKTVYVPVTKIVVKWKTKIVYRTKVVTKVVVKVQKVYVAGLHKNGVEGKG